MQLTDRLKRENTTAVAATTQLLAKPSLMRAHVQNKINAMFGNKIGDVAFVKRRKLAQPSFLTWKRNETAKVTPVE